MWFDYRVFFNLLTSNYPLTVIISYWLIPSLNFNSRQLTSRLFNSCFSSSASFFTSFLPLFSKTSNWVWSFLRCNLLVFTWLMRLLTYYASFVCKNVFSAFSAYRTFNGKICSIICSIWMSMDWILRRRMVSLEKWVVIFALIESKTSFCLYRGRGCSMRIFGVNGV